MQTILKTVEATVAEDGTITPAEPLTGPARAVVTLLIEQSDPTAVTRAAMAEPLEALPRFATLDELRAELDE